MIVFCDNEGCIVDAKGKPFQLHALLELQQTIREGKVRFSICTGRSTPYIEAICQCLGLVNSEIPSVCEGGAALYHPHTDSIELTCEAVRQEEVIALLPKQSFRVELGKAACVSVYPEPGYTVGELFQIIAAARHGNWNVTKSIAAVDVTPAGIDKKLGIERVLERLSLSWSDVVAIGDSWNDMPMLRCAKVSAAPANAVEEVKNIVSYVSPFVSTKGVTDIIRRFAWNEVR